jgi:hypothetical protein
VSALTIAASALAIVAALAGLVHCVRATRKTLLAAAVTIVVAWLSGPVLTVLQLVAAFNAGSRAAPEDKATLLAKSISNAMNCSAFALGATLIWVPTIIIGEVRRSRRRAAELQTPR